MKNEDSYLIDDLLAILRQSGFKAGRDNIHMVLFKLLDDHVCMTKTVEELKGEVA